MYIVFVTKAALKYATKKIKTLLFKPTLCRVIYDHSPKNWLSKDIFDFFYQDRGYNFLARIPNTQGVVRDRYCNVVLDLVVI